jgi:hypothetical protein
MALYTGGRYGERRHLFVGGGRFRYSFCGLIVSSQRRNYYTLVKVAGGRIAPYRRITCQACIQALQHKKFEKYEY